MNHIPWGIYPVYAIFNPVTRRIVGITHREAEAGILRSELEARDNTAYVCGMRTLDFTPHRLQ